MKKERIWVLFFNSILMVFLLLPGLILSQPATNFGVHGAFSNIQKRLLIKQGTMTAADEINAFLNAQPVGDGTYYFRLDLVQGSDYNFIFQSKVWNRWQFEQLPNTGSFPVSTDQRSAVTEKQGGSIIKTDDAKVRRKITVPQSGTNYYVFCNYGQHPNPPEVQAIPGDTQIILKIRTLGRWGYIEPDVEFGGHYSIYRSLTDKGPYTFIADINAGNGSYVFFTNTGLVNNIQYYYVVTAYDCYAGTNTALKRGPVNKEVMIPDYDTDISQDNIDANMFSGYSLQNKVIPAQAVNVIFKVENIDWSVVEDKNYFVYLTPWERDGRSYFDKLPARIIRVKPE